jgi:hypothetical protein
MMAKMKSFKLTLLTFVLCVGQGPLFASQDCTICAQLASTFERIRLDIGQDAFTTIHPPLDLLCVSNPEDKNAIGVIQRMHVHAPLSTLAHVLDDFPAYAELFPDLIRVEATKGEEPDTLLVKWTEEAPVIFMSNLVHEISYKMYNAPTQKVYRYSLKASRHLKYSEGQIVLLKDGENDTQFLEMDFYNADWSLLKILGSSRIWDENVKQLAQSDLAVKLKAENPAMSNRDARRKSEKSVDDKLVSDCLNHKVPLSPAAVLSPLKIAETAKP